MLEDLLQSNQLWGSTYPVLEIRCRPQLLHKHPIALSPGTLHKPDPAIELFECSTVWQFAAEFL